ncbi:MAG: polysulfide reductase [Spirochaetes bacterium RBG_16_49_21]|nr:MAG: polysulfide reductase [Spirochaetes bacterium RBG_16_49_21]
MLWLLFFIPGLTGIIIRAVSGERLAGYGSYVPWGLWIAVYFHAVGISGGAFAVGVIGYLRGVRGLKENLRTTLIVSAVSLMTGLLAIWLDLGRPFRAYKILVSPNFGSMLDFNAWMYGIFLALVGLVFYLSLNKSGEEKTNDRSGWLVPILSLGVFLSIAYPSQSGAFFGVVDAKPFWSSAILPVLFLTSAVTSGASAMLLVHYYLLGDSANSAGPDEEPFPYLRKIILAGIVVYFLGEFSEYSLALWSPISHIKETILLIMFGRFWWVFWIIHIGGALAGFYLLFRSRSLNRLAAGALIIVTSFISTRLNILIPGQSIPEIRGLNEAFTHPRLSFSYTPTAVEYLVALFVISFGLALFHFSRRLLATFIEKNNGRRQ